MEINIKFDQKMLVETANRVLDEFEYNGKTIREWADLIANPKTNADRIRAMSDEELAGWLADHPVVSEYDENNPQHKGWLDWLKQEVKE